VSVVYWLDTDYLNTVTVPLAPGGVNNVGLASWTGTLAAQPAGTMVTWWAQAVDPCSGATDYFSNAGNNYTYEWQ
jgi:hypothetical protein